MKQEKEYLTCQQSCFYILQNNSMEGSYLPDKGDAISCSTCKHSKKAKGEFRANDLTKCSKKCGLPCQNPILSPRKMVAKLLWRILKASNIMRKTGNAKHTQRQSIYSIFVYNCSSVLFMVIDHYKLFIDTQIRRASHSGKKSNIDLWVQS